MFCEAQVVPSWFPLCNIAWGLDHHGVPPCTNRARGKGLAFAVFLCAPISQIEDIASAAIQPPTFPRGMEPQSSVPLSRLGIRRRRRHYRRTQLKAVAYRTHKRQFLWNSLRTARETRVATNIAQETVTIFKNADGICHLGCLNAEKGTQAKPENFVAWAILRALEISSDEWSAAVAPCGDVV